MAGEIKEHNINKAKSCVNEFFEKVYSQNRPYIAGLLIAIDKEFYVETQMNEILVDYKGANYWEFYQELVAIIEKSFYGNFGLELWDEYKLGLMNMKQGIKHFLLQAMDDKNKEKFKG